MASLPEKLLAVDRALDGHGIEHAFGGAIALAYWTKDPRGTSDIDVNVFTEADQAESVLDALPDGVHWDQSSLDRIERDGQCRLFWDRTPLDLFFDYHELHHLAGANRRIVPFAGSEIPVLGPVELALFKASFNRTKDWADIEEMLRAETLDYELTTERIAEYYGAGDERIDRLAEALRRAR